MKIFKNKKIYFNNFIGILLTLCFIQLSINVVQNISKLIMYNIKLAEVNNAYKEALLKKEQLTYDIKHVSAEEIARNKLKMAMNDEIVINLIKNAEQESQRKSFEYMYY